MDKAQLLLRNRKHAENASRLSAGETQMGYLRRAAKTAVRANNVTG